MQTPELPALNPKLETVEVSVSDQQRHRLVEYRVNGDVVGVLAELTYNDMVSWVVYVLAADGALEVAAVFDDDEGQQLGEREISTRYQRSGRRPEGA